MCNCTSDSGSRSPIRRIPRSDSARLSRIAARPIHSSTSRAMYHTTRHQGPVALLPDPSSHQHQRPFAAATSIRGHAAQLAVHPVASRQGPATIHPSLTRSPAYSPTHPLVHQHAGSPAPAPSMHRRTARLAVYPAASRQGPATIHPDLARSLPPLGSNWPHWRRRKAGRTRAWGESMKKANEFQTRPM